MKTVLIVEVDRKLCDRSALEYEKQGFRVLKASTSKQAITLLQMESIDMLVANLHRMDESFVEFLQVMEDRIMMDSKPQSGSA